MKTHILKLQGVVGLLTLVARLALPTAALADPTPATPPAPLSSAADPSPPAPAPAPAVTRTTVALIAAGVAVVGAGVGTTFSVLALQNKNDFGNKPTYASSDDGNNDAAYADGAFALAIAAGVTSLVLLLTNDAGSADAPAGTTAKRAVTVSAVPLVTLHGGGAGALLRF